MLAVLLTVGYVALFLYLIHRWDFFCAAGLSKNAISSIFLLKVLCGTILWAIYTYHYNDRANTDIFKFFDDSKVMYDALWEQPQDYFRMLFGIQNDNAHFTENYYSVMNNWSRKYESKLHNDSHMIIRFNAAVRLFSFGVYHVHTVFVCFISLIGLVGIYRAFEKQLSNLHNDLIAAVFLLPSALFWGSGVLKESLLMFALGIFLLYALHAANGRISVKAALAMLFGLALMFFLKIYVIASLLPALLAYIWCKRTADRRPLLKFTITLVTFALIGLNLQHLFPGWDLLQILATKQHDFIGHAILTQAGSAIDTPRIEPTLVSFLAMSPRAMFNVLLGPTVLMSGGMLGYISGLENAAIILVVVASVLFRKSWIQMDRTTFLLCLTFVVLLFLLVGWTTTIMGAIVRYRIPALPFLLITALLAIDKSKLLHRIPKLRAIYR